MYADGIVHKSTTLTLDVVMVQNDNTRQCVILSTIHPELPPPHCFGVKKPWACACYQLFWRHHPARLQVAQRHDKIVADGQACSCEDAVRYRVWHWPRIGGIDGSNCVVEVDRRFEVVWKTRQVGGLPQEHELFCSSSRVSGDVMRVW